MNAGRVLVVDDEEALRSVCRRVLEKSGLQVETADGRAGALERLRRGTFELVLTDLQMQGTEDGVELTGEVKALSPGTEVIVMTGHPSLATAIPAMRRGAYDYIVKPFEPEALELTVARCLERRQLAAELSEERGLRRELESAYAELKKFERLKDGFLGRVNHELRTPIAIAMLAAETLKGSVAADADRHRLDKLHDGLQRLRDTIEEILLFSKVADPELPLAKASVQPRALLDALLARFEPLRAEKGLSVEVTEKGGPVAVSADPALLESALRHLLLNAFRFNKPGGRVAISLVRAHGEARVAFADSGIGVALDQRERLFDPFYQAAEHMTREVGGLGLGLATVRRVAEAHGGRVEFQAGLDGGSAFVLVLPA